MKINPRVLLGIPGASIGPVFSLPLDDENTVNVYVCHGGRLKWRWCKSQKKNKEIPNSTHNTHSHK